MTVARTVSYYYYWRGEVTLRLTVSQSVLISSTLVGSTTRYYFLPECCCLKICCVVSVGRPLWREDGSVVCTIITQWSESHRTLNNTLLSHLRLPQPGVPGYHIYIPQEQGGPLRRLLWLAEIRWKYSNPPLQEQDGPVQSQKSKSR
jgi:hypothetical protein